MNLELSAAKGVLWSSVETIGVRVMSLAVILVLARIIEPSAFGLVAMVAVVIALAEIFLDLGLSDAIVQHSMIGQRHLDSTFWVATMAGSILMALGIALSKPIAQLFNEPALAPVLRWWSIGFLFAALGVVHQSYLLRKFSFRGLAAKAIISTSIGSVVAIAMALAGFGVWSLVGKSLVTGFVGLIILWVLSEWRPSFSFSLQHVRSLFSYGSSMVGSRSVDFLNRYSDDLMIGFFLGSSQLGFYALGYNLLLAATELVTSVPNKAAFALFSRLQEDPERMRSAFLKGIRLISLIAIPAFVGMSILAGELVFTLYGQEWAPTVPVVRILAIVGALHSIQYLHGNLLKAAGKPNWRFGILSLLGILNLLAFYLVVERGIAAVSAAYAIVSFLVFPLYLLVTRKLLGLRLMSYFQSLRPALIATAVMLGAIVVSRSVLGESLPAAVRLVIYTLIGAAAYATTIRLTARSAYGELRDLIELALS